MKKIISRLMATVIGMVSTVSAANAGLITFKGNEVVQTFEGYTPPGPNGPWIIDGVSYNTTQDNIIGFYESGPCPSEPGCIRNVFPSAFEVFLSEPANRVGTLIGQGAGVPNGIFRDIHGGIIGTMDGVPGPQSIYFVGFETTDPIISSVLIGNLSPNVASTLDDFTYEIDVPEPTTLAILGLGLAGLGVMRRRRAA